MYRIKDSLRHVSKVRCCILKMVDMDQICDVVADMLRCLSCIRFSLYNLIPSKFLQLAIVSLSSSDSDNLVQIPEDYVRPTSSCVVEMEYNF